jgi:hypothetical protein
MYYSGRADFLSSKFPEFFHYYSRSTERTKAESISFGYAQDKSRGVFVKKLTGNIIRFLDNLLGCRLDFGFARKTIEILCRTSDCLKHYFTTLKKLVFEALVT